MEVGSSAINVGTLTAAALYTSISSAQDLLCPSAGPVCKTDSVEIDNIAYVKTGLGDTGLYHDGKITVSVASSQYRNQIIRDALIKSSAASVNGSATGTNCALEKYTDYSKRKRSLEPSDSDHHPTNLTARQSFGSDYTPTTQSINICGAIQFTGAHYYAPDLNIHNVVGIGTDFIDAGWTFQEGKGDGDVGRDLLCDFVTELIDSVAIEVPAVGT